MNSLQLQYEMIQTKNLKFEVATHGQGQKLALLLHGFPESAHSYRYQIPLLMRLGYRVWAPNLRGYGKSDKPRGRRAYAMDRLEQDVTDLIDASGARSVLLVGHDWGGTLAFSYATYGPRPIERLVVMNAPHPVCFRRELKSVQQLWRSAYMLFFQLPWLPELLWRARDFQRVREAFAHQMLHRERLSDADVDAFVESAREPGALTAMINWYRAMPWSFAQLSKRGARPTTMPTLMLWGEQDPYFSPSITDGTEQLVPKLTLERIADASHRVQQDAPERVNALLESWLAASYRRPSTRATP